MAAGSQQGFKRPHSLEKEEPGSDKQILSAVELLNCRIDHKTWQCPVVSCQRRLCRKQTLQSHVSSQHGISSEELPKRYKLYELDESIPIPRSTSSYWQSKERETGNNHVESMPEGATCSSTEKSAVEHCSVELNEDHGEFQASEVQTAVWETDVDTETEQLSSLPNFELPPTLVDQQSDESDISISGDSSEADTSDGENFSDNEDQSTREANCAVCDPSTLSPPVYVIPSHKSTYVSPLTRQQHVLAVTAYATHHNLSDTAVKDLLSLIQLHLPESNIGEQNVNTLKESCGFNEGYLQYHMYCNSCNKLFLDSETCTTPGCGNIRGTPANQSYFVTGNVQKQMTEILERDGIWEAIKETRNCDLSNNVSDITSGSEYLKLKEPGEFLHSTDNVTLTLFTDGIPLFKSSSVALWPVYLLVNEIPPKQRFLRKNMLLWGIWQGVSKPKMNMFLRPLVIDLLELYHKGLVISKTNVPIRAMLVVATMDLPARAAVLQMTQHNGQFGCLYCMEPGEVVKSGKGTCRSFPFKNPPLLPAKLRSHSEIKKNAEAAQKDHTRHCGFLGMSVLLYLTYFSFTTNVVIDYMHGILLGVTKKLLSLWLEPINSKELYFIGNQVKQLDNILKNVQPPYMIHRLPRKMKGNYHHWKASELRSWLLFYSLPCLKDILPATYITHFSCLVEGTYILLGEGISAADLVRAEWLLYSFVRNTPLLYKENVMGINVHNLTHIVDCVRNWGPMWAWSCFAFESFNGEIKKGIHGTGNVCRQIFWHLQGQKQVEMYLLDGVPAEPVKNFLKNISEGTSSRFPRGTDAYQCSVVRLTQFRNFTGEIKGELERITGCTELTIEDFMTAAKIVRNGFIMYSRKCTKVKKRNSYTIRLEGPLADIIYVDVQQYILQKSTNRVFAVCKQLKAVGSVLERRTPYLQQLEYSPRLQLVKVEALREPAVAIWTGKRLYAGLLPNHMERD